MCKLNSTSRIQHLLNKEPNQDKKIQFVSKKYQAKQGLKQKH